MSETSPWSKGNLQAAAKTELPAGVTFAEFLRSVQQRVMNPERDMSVHQFSRSFKPPVRERFIEYCMMCVMEDRISEAKIARVEEKFANRKPIVGTVPCYAMAVAR